MEAPTPNTTGTIGHGRKAYRRRRRRSAGGGQLARPLGARRRRRPRGETGVPSPWPKGVNKHPQPAVSRPVIPTLVRNLVRRHRYGTVLLWRKCSEAPAREGHLVREKDNLNGPEELSAQRRDDWGGTPSETGEHNNYARERATTSVLDFEASEERYFPASSIASTRVRLLTCWKLSLHRLPRRGARGARMRRTTP